jgi:hypothetical protein
MATFQAPKGYVFTDENDQTWARFTQVTEPGPSLSTVAPGTTPVYQFTTTDPEIIAKLQAAQDVTQIS